MSPEPSVASEGAAARYRRAKQLFNAVCDLPNVAAQRAALQDLGADTETLTQVLHMLAPVSGTTRFSSSVAQTAVQWLGSQLRPGDRLGAWTLVRPLGEGGMGRVYLAERSDGHYQQQAAIKLLLGWSGTEALARLTAERQILAGLNHPHIAKLLDGGTTPSGQPYLVMEYADGDTIDRWCEHQHAPLAQRLALFGTVCDAVAHAHRHLVIHCDIKPSNVLVNRDGRAMLLDFGVARLQGQGADAAVGMTAGYASPEQVAGQTPGVPSDIYGLGRLLAELMLPVASNHPRGLELAAVVARATAHLPEQRYGSADDLQRDLQRLLAHQAVAAMGDSSAYLLRKALRRHWAWLLAGAAAVALTMALTVQLTLQFERARVAELAARQAQP